MLGWCCQPSSHPPGIELCAPAAARPSVHYGSILVCGDPWRHIDQLQPAQCMSAKWRPVHNARRRPPGTGRDWSAPSAATTLVAQCICHDPKTCLRQHGRLLVLLYSWHAGWQQYAAHCSHHFLCGAARRQHPYSLCCCSRHDSRQLLVLPPALPRKQACVVMSVTEQAKL